MNPELPQVHASAEAAPQIPGGVEYFPDGTVQSPETLPSYDRQPAPVEQAPAAAVAPPVAVPALDPQQAAVPQAPTPVAPVQDTPAIAGDDDLIEKEWVDKAKKIIALTKGSPYEQAKAIAALQVDYLKKRYNRSVGEGES